MATRIYLPSTGSAPASPAYDTSWDVTTSAARLPCYTAKQSSAMTSASVSGDANKADQDHLIRQYVSKPMGAQTIGVQTLKWQIRASETDVDNNLFTTISVRSWNGSTFQTILALARDNTELTTSLVNRQFSASTSSVTVAAGDRLVIEVGLGGDPAQTGSDYHNGSVSIGDDSGTDLGENDTDTNAYNPWVEFGTTTISFIDTYTKTNTADAVVVTRTSKTHTSDAIVKAISTKTNTADAVIVNPWYIKTHTANAIVSVISTKSFTSDAWIFDTTKGYTYQDSDTLLTGSDNYDTLFESADYTAVGTDDTSYVTQGGSYYKLFMFRNRNTNNTYTITPTWIGQCTLAPSSGYTVYLQIYNRTSQTWTTLDSDATTGANTDITLTGTQSTGLTDYYDSNYEVICRVYQGGPY